MIAVFRRAHRGYFVWYSAVVGYYANFLLPRRWSIISSAAVFHIYRNDLRDYLWQKREDIVQILQSWPRCELHFLSVHKADEVCDHSDKEPTICFYVAELRSRTTHGGCAFPQQAVTHHRFASVSVLFLSPSREAIRCTFLRVWWLLRDNCCNHACSHTTETFVHGRMVKVSSCHVLTSI